MSSHRTLPGKARLSGAHLHLHHLCPGTKACVLMEEHQVGGGAWLLRQHKALVLVLGNGDLEGVPGQGASAWQF